MIRIENGYARRGDHEAIHDQVSTTLSHVTLVANVGLGDRTGLENGRRGRTVTYMIGIKVLQFVEECKYDI